MSGITIPPEAVEAAAMALAEECYGDDISDAHKYWTEFKEQAHIAIRAALKAWPMRQVRAWDDVQGVGVFIILPLPQETRDE